MTVNSWNWKTKDGNRNGLLYESGNWGDLLKLAWLLNVLDWKAQSDPVRYFDPFAGDVRYPLGEKSRFRFETAGLRGLDRIRRPFMDIGFWPSSAAAVLPHVASMEVFDADEERRRRWQDQPGVTVLSGESGWELLREKISDDHGLWLLDPYDFLAEWKEMLPLVLEKAASSTILLYIYNRAAKNNENFTAYRAFRNALDKRRTGLPKRLGRVAADGFLPRSHHEMLFLPSRGDCVRPGFGQLLLLLAQTTYEINAALDRSALFDA